MRRLYGLIAVILVLGLLVSCGSRLPGPRTIILGPRVTSVTTPTDLNAGDSWTFVATVSGSPIITWSWNFDGGATPNTSTAMSPTVVLVNPSTTTDATYNASVTVADADGRSYTYNFTFTVGETLNQAPVFVGLPASITGGFTFSINDPDGDDVTIALTLVSGDVTVSPMTIAATSANYGPFNITVANNGVDEQVVSIDISLDDGINAAVTDNVGGTIAGVALDPDSIYILAPASVNVGDRFNVMVYASAPANAVAYFNSIEIAYPAGLPPDDIVDNSVDPPIVTSWNLGAPGGSQWFKDGGFWTASTDGLLTFGADIFFAGDTIAVNISALGIDDSPPIGVPAGTSGPLFNLYFFAEEAGVQTLSFVHAGTNYSPPTGGAVYYFDGGEFGVDITVN